MIGKNRLEEFDKPLETMNVSINQVNAGFQSFAKLLDSLPFVGFFPKPPNLISQFGLQQKYFVVSLFGFGFVRRGRPYPRQAFDGSKNISNLGTFFIMPSFAIIILQEVKFPFPQLFIIV